MKFIAPLTKTQYGLYVECVNHQGEACYNIPYLYTFDGSMDEEKLKSAIEAAVAAHPTLFTRIELSEQGDPQQVIDDSEKFVLTVESVDDIEAEKARFVQPFDLYADRLFRIRLLRDTKNFYLLQDIHHIISDGSSRKVLLADIEKAYQGEPLVAEEMSLAAVATAEEALRQSDAFETDKQWYAQHFDCGDTYSPLLPDLEEEEHQEGLMTRKMRIEMAEVERFCQENGIYKSTFFTAAYSFLLAKYNNEQEVLFSTIHNGRSDKRLAHTMGMLVKTLPAYAKFDNDTSVLDFLKAGQEQMSGCRQHEAYAYSDMVTDLGLQAATTFAWHGTLFSQNQFCEKPLSQQRLNNNTRECPIYVKAYSKEASFFVEAEYSANEYSETLISQFLESYEAVVGGFLAQERLSDISISTATQVELLNSFNQNDVDYDNTQTIVSLFRRQAKATPQNIAVVYQDKRFTYAEVDEISDCIAGYIAQKGLGSEDVVSVLIPRCEWMAIASLGVLKAGCAYQPLDPSYPKERLNFMMQDANAKLLISDKKLRDIVDEYKGEVIMIEKGEMIMENEGGYDSASASHTPASINPDSLFILLYTSGSTGVPKGCQLTHANLVTFCHWYQRYYGLKPEHRVAAYASYGFDACMMDMYPALTCGATVHIIPEDLRLDFIALNNYFEQNGITHSFMTTQVGYQFATSIENHSLKYLSTGGEKLASLTPPKDYQFFNVYGPTECTIFTTTFKVEKKMREIPIGKPLDNMRLYVVDPQGHRLPVGAAGELWIAGPQVSRGYLNRPEKTAEVYICNPFTQDEKYMRVYRSGDIVRYLPSGDIQFVGRRDGQVKIRGFRIELKEVEAIIREFPGIKEATVQAFDEEGGSGGKFIAAYIVSDKEIDIEALNNFILEQKPPYMVPAVTMQIDRIPLNQNQKVNKRALPKPEKKAAVVEESNVPMNMLEQELHEMIAGIVNNTEFGITTVLGYAGLTSISAIKLAVQVNKRYGIILDAKSLVKNGTLQSIENEIWKQMTSKGGATAATPERPQGSTSQASSPASVPLSYAQTGVYFDCLKNPETTLYNIPNKIAFPQQADTTALAEAVKTLVQKHPEMTVHFENGEEGIVQTVDLEQAVEIPVKQMSEDELAQYKHDFVKPFDLGKGPLYRFEIVTTENQTYLLMDVHHLIFDGGSVDIFLQQLCSIMNAEPIEDEDQPYTDYVMAEKTAEGGADYQAATEFFKGRLSVVEAATEVRPDLPNPVKGTISKAISALDIKAIDAFCRNHHITPAHLILSAVYYSLSRFANSEQVCITTVSGGRSNLRIRNTVGMFVNTLALSASIGKQTVDEFLQEVSANFDEALRHENYPFAQIAADYGLTAEIQFVYQLGVISQYICQGSPLELEGLELKVPKFPITFFVRELNGQACVCVEYDNGKYSERLMQSLADAVKVTAERMIAKPEAALTSISIVSDEEAERLIKIGTGKEIDVDVSKTFANLFTEQAQRTPDAPAVVDKDSQLTYAEMDRYSNALAHQLIDFGVRPNDFVCVMLDRTKEFPLAVLSIHKAAAAYTPLDFEYPNERLSYMLENSESKVLITTHDVLEAKEAEGDFSTAAAKTFFIDDFMAEVANSPSADCQPIDLSNPEGLAYMIYTSGSTGKPKGAMLHQAGLRNFIAVVIDMEKLTANDRISGHRSFSFDAHIEDMYPVLTLGGSFHIMPTEIRKDLAAIRQFLFDHQCTGGGYSTAMTCLLLNTFDDLPIRFTTGGGEKMDGVYSDHIEIINVYGPTECTDDTSYYSIAPGRRVENIPIGQSVANNWNFIVDTAGNLVPQGVAGELCFAGIQVGRGYWRLPERTAKSFVDCPFVKQDRWGRPVRMYHTGDLCRWNEDGQIEYMGRIDTQVKLRGFRIELGEIESKALNIEGIGQAAAEVRKVMGNEHLVLYYTLEANAMLSDEDIRATLAASSLADYMVPDAYMRMDAMPMTPNGKINRKALPTPEMKRATEYEVPKGEMENLFCNIFSDILKIKEVGATDNFFEIGGTSINAIKVIVEASKHGVQIVFNDIFSLKTPRALAAFVNGAKGETVAESPEEATPVLDTPEAAHYAPLNAILERNTLAAFREGKRQPIGDVLLTGATGYLGIHILNELLSRFHGKVLCPIRAKGDAEALSRIKTLYFYYFGRTEAFSHFDERVTAFAAEVTEASAFDHLNEKLTVINCVANVKHFSAGNDIEMVNIESVRHLIAFCVRTDSRLIHISTNSISGISVDNVPGPEVKLTEQSFYIGQKIDANKYVYSKFKAEELILDAIAHHGLNAKIMRVGNLSARQKDGEFQINFNTNNFLAKLRAYVVIGMVPYQDLDQRFEFSPIDEVAGAIMQLAQTPKECIVFHPCNTHRQFLSDILTGFSEAGITLKRVEMEEFQQALEKMMDNPDLVTLLRPLMAYNMGGSHKMRWIESTNDYTTQVLYRIGFQWPATAADYVHRFVDTIVGFDYFNVG